MIEFILNNQNIATDLPAGTTVLDFVRYHKNLKGTKIGCREGDCGACTVLVGELGGDSVKYRSMTSCLMPLANAAGKHIVTVEGINPEDGSLTPVQQAMIDESGTQCGFCTVGFVMSLTGFCIDETAKTPEMAVSAVDGNICRCTGYKSIERAADRICGQLTGPQASRLQTPPSGVKSVPSTVAGSLSRAIEDAIVPNDFSNIKKRLGDLGSAAVKAETRNAGVFPFVGGGTDVYVQRPDELTHSSANHLFYDEQLRGSRDTGDFIEMGASTTVTDLLVSPVMQSIFPDLYKHLKLVSSTPIRNMATLAGNFVNASPIGDMTVWFLALDASIILASGNSSSMSSVNSVVGNSGKLQTTENTDRTDEIQIRIDGLAFREIPLRDLYLGYKQLAKSEDEFIISIRFRRPVGDFRFNFEKVCKRTYLDIATVNTAISLRMSDQEPDIGPPVPVFLKSAVRDPQSKIEMAHVAAGGVAPIPLYLKETSSFLKGKEVSAETIAQANEIMQSEISPISDVRGTETYKRLLLRQLFTAHFVESFGFVDDLLS